MGTASIFVEFETKEQANKAVESSGKISHEGAEISVRLPQLFAAGRVDGELLVVAATATAAAAAAAAAALVVVSGVAGVSCFRCLADGDQFGDKS